MDNSVGTRIVMLRSCFEPVRVRRQYPLKGGWTRVPNLGVRVNRHNESQFPRTLIRVCKSVYGPCLVQIPIKCDVPVEWERVVVQLLCRKNRQWPNSSITGGIFQAGLLWL